MNHSQGEAPNTGAESGVVGMTVETVAGLRQRRRAQSTGTVVVVVDARAQGLDESGGRWYTECVDHGEMVAHDTLALARWFAPSPESWCSECAASDVAVSTSRGKDVQR